MVHPEVGAVGAQLLGGYRQLDRLQEGVGSRARTEPAPVVQWPKERNPIFFTLSSTSLGPIDSKTALVLLRRVEPDQLALKVARNNREAARQGIPIH